MERVGNTTRKGPDLGQSLRIRSLFRKLPSHRWGFPFVRLNIEPFFLFLFFFAFGGARVSPLFDDRLFVGNGKGFFLFFREFLRSHVSILRQEILMINFPQKKSIPEIS